MPERKFIIDPQFASFLPALSEDAKQRLEDKILAEGFRESLIIWKEQNILLDGHNRLEICERLGLKYYTETISLPSRAAALNWILQHAIGRRNLTPKQIAYLIGSAYNLCKKHRGGIQDEAGETAQQLADAFGVSRKTVNRHAIFAAAADAIAEDRPELRELILTGTFGTISDVIASGKTKQIIFCDTCKERGPSRRCKECKRLRAEAKEQRDAGDDSAGDAANSKAAKDNGKIKFSWTKFDKFLGPFMRFIDQVADAYPAEKDSLEQRRLFEIAKDYVKVFTAWRDRIQGMKGKRNGKKESAGSGTRAAACPASTTAASA